MQLMPVLEYPKGYQNPGYRYQEVVNRGYQDVNPGYQEIVTPGYQNLANNSVVINDMNGIGIITAQLDNTHLHASKQIQNYGKTL